jgi:hypothetical protein
MMTNISGEKPPEPKRTLDDKQVSDVQTDQTEEQKGTPQAGEQSNEFEEKFGKMESELGRLRQELGDERKKAEELNAYKLWYDQNAARMQQQVPQQREETQNLDERFFDKPTETVMTILQRQKIQERYEKAYSDAPTAEFIARQKYPEKFEGVDENLVKQAMYGIVQSGQVDPMLLTNPDAWANAAWAARGMQSNYAVPQSPQQPLQPTQTESPGMSPTNPEQEIPDIQGDALTDRLVEEAKRLGITKEDFLKDVQATREGVE